MGALLESGYEIADPSALVNRVYRLMSKELGVDPDAPIKEVEVPEGEEEEAEEEDDKDESDDDQDGDKDEKKEENNPNIEFCGVYSSVSTADFLPSVHGRKT